MNFFNKRVWGICLLLMCLSTFSIYAESFTLCDGFSYQDIPSDYNLPVDSNLNFEENEFIRREDLRLLKFKCFGFDDEIHDKELVVAYKVKNPLTGKICNVAKETLEIFKELFEKKYPINEASCFNFRNIAKSNKLSWHSYGLAIDINYQENPCLIIGEDGKIVKTIPEGLEKYSDRNLNEKGMIKVGDDCYNAFASRGWEWGGSWNTPVDYMHFQKFPWNYPRPAPKYKTE